MADEDMICGSERWPQKAQAQAMLDLFEQDYGRTPATLEEVREWARAQSNELLVFRVNRSLELALDVHASTPASVPIQ